MALRNPPSWLQNGSHPAENDRLTTQALFYTTGVVGFSTLPTNLQVTQNSPTGMSVLIGQGWAAIVGTTTTNMGTYMVYNDGSATATITTANPSNPRIDRICLTVSDAYYSGALNQVAINVVAGTPAVSPVAPATPANSISLATVAVAAGATQILTANITDTRVETTTLLPVGDITAVTAGTGISVASGTGPIPVVSTNSTVIAGYTTTATAGGTTTLTASSTTRQLFTGTLAQTIVLPVTSTLSLGSSFKIRNLSTGTLTVNSSGGNLVASIPAGAGFVATCILTSGTTAASWDADFEGTSAITGTGNAVLATSPTLTTPTITTPIITIGQNTPTFTTNAYTLVLADQYELMLASNGATAGTVNIPTNATAAFPVGTQITILQTGAGQLTIAATTPGTTTVLSSGATAAQPKLRVQYSSATCIKTATDTWYVVGDIV